MNKKELFEKIYNSEIKENDVIVEIDKDEEEYPSYIVNDGFDYWYFNGDGTISLNFFENDDNNYEIITMQEFQKIQEEKEKKEKIEKLKEELKRLEG
jgi:hypothetical protein